MKKFLVPVLALFCILLASPSFALFSSGLGVSGANTDTPPRT